MNKFLDWLIPRFMVDEVALKFNGDLYEIVCSTRDLQEHEKPDAVATMQIFNLFGFALFPKMIGDVRKL